jgi:myo-inositol 2-dehydrogenase / D-chiro-inositol 1-dehydrogenase
MEPLRIATIGAGGFGRRHLDVLERLGGALVVGHHTRTLESAERLARRYGGRAYGAVDAMLDAERPEAVWIAVHPAAHGDAELACIARGIPFLVEKPLSADRDTAERIHEVLAGSGLVSAVGYHWRAFDTLGELRERLAGAPVRMVRGAWHGATPSPAWWSRRAGSGGQMVEQATHVLDLARHLLGEAEVLSAAALEVERDAHPDADVAVASAATLRYDQGALGLFSATCALAGPAEIELAFYAEGLHVVIDQAGVRYDDGREVRTVRHARDPIEVENEAFLAAVRASDPSRVLCSYADALGTHRLTHAIAEAAR